MLAAANAWVSSHKALFAVALAAFGIFGFRLITPSTQLHDLDARVSADRLRTDSAFRAQDSVLRDIRRQADSTIGGMLDHLDYTTRVLEALAREQCLRSPRYETQLTGLPCTSLLMGMGRSPARPRPR